MVAKSRLIAPPLFFIGFLFLLLVSLSIPIIKTIYFFYFDANISAGIGPLRVTASTNVKFGTWGYCTSGARVE